MSRYVRAVFLVVAAALLLLAISSDALAGGVRLRQIVEEAKKPKSKQKVVRPEPSQTKQKAPRPAPAPPPTEYRAVEVIEYYPPLISSPPRPLYHHHYYASPGPRPHPIVRPRIGVVGGGGALATDLIDGYASAGALLGALIHPVSLDLRGYYSRPRFTPDVSSAFQNIESYAGDVVMRIHLAPHTARAGANLMVSGRLGRYSWSYRNPVDVLDGDGLVTIKGDSMKFRTLLFGLGIEPFRAPGVSFSLTAAAGIQRFDDVTRRGFENDLFEDGRVYELLAEFVISP